ncbi:hypothetical protein O9992_08880 [Vibrio lentus]|nr:hypothetical protein [Vibrio lentus]
MQKTLIFAAHLARDSRHKIAQTGNSPRSKYLMPDPIETLKAAEQLVKDGFVVLPYCHARPRQ